MAEEHRGVVEARAHHRLAALIVHGQATPPIRQRGRQIVQRVQRLHVVFRMICIDNTR